MLKRLMASFNNAFSGIVETVRTQANMKIHMVMSIIVLIMCLFLNISRFELIALVLCVAFVMFAELINTALENIVNLTAQHYHPLAKRAKDAAAGAVLVSAMASVIIGFLIFGDKLSDINFNVVNAIKSKNSWFIFFVLIILFIFTIILKSLIGEGTPLRGGMPSGHSTLSFSLATIIAITVKEPMVVALSYALALVVCQSRIDAEIHNIWEVLVGALLGMIITAILFLIFKGETFWR